MGNCLIAASWRKFHKSSMCMHSCGHVKHACMKDYNDECVGGLVTLYVCVIIHTKGEVEFMAKICTKFLPVFTESTGSPTRVPFTIER